jgi:hypothetical protein
MKQILIASLIFYSWTQSEQQTISGLLANSTEATEKLYDIYDLNVFRYFGLTDYDTELKQTVFKKTSEYQSKLAELTISKAEMQKTTYYSKLSEAFGNVDYDVKRKGFEIETGSNFAAYRQNAKPPKSVYIHLDEECIILKALPTKQVSDSYSGGKKEMFFISVDEENGLEIENDKANADIYFFFTPSGKEKSSSTYYVVNPMGTYNITGTYLKSDKVRVVVANKLSGKIYFDKVYSYQSPKK